MELKGIIELGEGYSIEFYEDDEYEYEIIMDGNKTGISGSPKNPFGIGIHISSSFGEPRYTINECSFMESDIEKHFERLALARKKAGELKAKFL